MRSFKDKKHNHNNKPFPFNYRSWVPNVEIPEESEKYIRVLNYNLLCDSLSSVSTNMYEEDLAKLPYMHWQNRRKVIVKEVLDLKADIVCFQEFERDEELIKELGASGYNVIISSNIVFF